MKNPTKKVVSALILSAAATGLAVAEETKIDLIEYNSVVGIASAPIIPDEVDVELVARICADDPDKHLCLGEGLQKAIE